MPAQVEHISNKNTLSEGIVSGNGERQSGGVKEVKGGREKRGRAASESVSPHLRLMRCDSHLEGFHIL